MTQPVRLILASQSPQRRNLLEQAGYSFDIIPPRDDVEGPSLERESPRSLVSRLARLKAADVARRVETGIVLGCDTVVECQGQVLGKPRDRQHARQMLQMLNGSLHHVYSGLCLWRRPGDTSMVQVDVTKLRMELLRPEELEAYLESNAWEGKAGAFGYQDRPGWLEIVAGSESNVIGLPLELLASMIPKIVA